MKDWVFLGLHTSDGLNNVVQYASDLQMPMIKSDHEISLIILLAVGD